LGKGNEKIQTVEHLLSAIRWLGIADLEITVDGDEIPVLDGSAKEWIEKLSPHLYKTDEKFPEGRLKKPIFLQEGESSIKALPGDSLFVRYTIDFPGTPVGKQTWEGEIDPDIYKTEISPARTFGFLHEVEALRKRGLALGGNLNNAVVIGDGGFLAPLRFPDEIIKHKVLDLLGDLALVPWIPLGNLEVVKGSHRLHTAFASAVEGQAKER